MRIKKTQIKLILSLVTVIIVPLFAFYYFSYNFIEGTYKKDEQSNSIASLGYIYNRMDGLIFELCTVASQASEIYEFQRQFLTTDDFNYVVVQKKLHNFISSNKTVDELMYYLKGTDILISSKSRYTVSSFINSIYRYDDWTMNDFSKNINNIDTMTWRGPENVKYHSMTGIRFLTVMIPMPINSKYPNAALIYIIKESSLYNLLGFDPSSASGIVIFDEKNSVVLSSANMEAAVHKLTDIFSQDAEVQTQTIVIDNENYLVAHNQSQITGWKYFHITPEDIVLAKAIELSNKLIWLLLIVFLIELILALGFYRYIYKPIRSLRNTIREYDNTAISGFDEIECVRTRFIELVNMKNSLNETIRKNYEAMEQQSIGELLNCNYLDEEKKNCISMIYDTFICIVVNIFEENSELSLSVVISNTRADDSDDIIVHGIDTAGSGRYVIIFNYMHNMQTDVESCISRLYSYLLSCSKGFTIGTGTPVKDLTELRSSYHQASEAVEYCYIKGICQIIGYDEVRKSNISMPPYPKKELDKLQKALYNSNTKDAKAVLDLLATQLRFDRASLFFTRIIVYEIINIILKSLYETENLSHMASEEYTALMSVSEARSIDQVFSSLNEIIERSISDSLQNALSPGSIKMAGIIRYIQENYSKHWFSAGAAADYFEMSMSNFSHSFKKFFGVNVHTYITKLRLDKANELIRDTDKPLKEIIEEIGYSDVSSFIKKFRQNFGYSPGELRKAVK